MLCAVSPGHRVLLSAGVSLGCNLLYAIYNGALGILSLSSWFAAMCAFYSILAVMRFAAVLCGWRSHLHPGRDAQRQMGRLLGLLLAALSMVLARMNALSLAQGRVERHGEIVMISIAAYTFYKMGVSVVQAIRQRKDPSLLLAGLRRVRRFAGKHHGRRRHSPNEHCYRGDGLLVCGRAGRHPAAQRRQGRWQDPNWSR